MIEYLKELGVPILLSGLIGLLVIICIELWNLIKIQRLKNAETVFKSIMNEMDDSLHYFYLPLKERLLVTKNIYAFSQKFVDQGIYLNSKLGIESTDPKALRNIFVRRIFVPLNTEIENLIKNHLHHKRIEDNTNYEKILEHYTLWRSLEEARIQKEIDNYEGENILEFPSEELDKILSFCNNLIEEQKKVRKKVLKLQSIYNDIIK